MNRASRLAAVFFGFSFIAILLLVGCKQGGDEQNKNKLKVLALLPLSGPAASQGNFIKNGIGLYQADHPDSGLEIEFKDSQAKPAEAVSIFSQTVMQNRPDLVICAISMVCGAVISKAESEGIFTIATLTSSASVLNSRLLSQRFFPPSADINSPATEYAKARFKTAAIIYSNEDFGVAGRDFFKTGFENKERQIVAIESYPLTDINVIRDTTLKTIKDNPDAVFVVGYGAAYLEIFKTLRALDYKGQILSNDAFAQPSYLDTLGELSNNVIFSGMDSEMSSPSKSAVGLFIEQYRKQFNKQTHFDAVVAYEMTSIIDQIHESGKPFTPQTFQDLGEWKGKLIDIKFLPNGECSFPMQAILRKDGKNVAVD